MKHLADYRDRCRLVETRRNRELAHADFGTFLQQHGNAKGLQIPGPSRQEIEDALEALRKFMDAIEVHFNSSPMAYEHFTSGHDGNSLVWILKQGLRYQELREAQVIPFDDLKNFDRYDA